MSAVEDNGEVNNARGQGGGGRGGTRGRGGRGGTLRARRGPKFNDDEVMIALDFIEEILPISGLEWDSVTSMHAERFQDLDRTKESIKRKFSSLYHSRIPTGDPECPITVLRAKRIQRSIEERSDAVEEVAEEELGFEEEATAATESGENEQDDEEAGAPTAASAPVAAVAATPVAVTARGRRGRGFSPHGSRGNDTNDMKEMFFMSMLQKLANEPSEEEKLRRQQRREEEERQRREDRRMQVMMNTMMMSVFQKMIGSPKRNNADDNGDKSD